MSVRPPYFKGGFLVSVQCSLHSFVYVVTTRLRQSAKNMPPSPFSLVALRHSITSGRQRDMRLRLWLRLVRRPLPFAAEIFIMTGWGAVTAAQLRQRDSVNAHYKRLAMRTVNVRNNPLLSPNEVRVPLHLLEDGELNEAFANKCEVALSEDGTVQLPPRAFELLLRCSTQWSREERS